MDMDKIATSQVDSDPSGRYVRSETQLRVRPNKVVWSGFDTVEGKEVAWNVIQADATSLERIERELATLASINDHPHVVNVLHYWHSEDKTDMQFITELITSVTLRESFTQNTLSSGLVQAYCRQLLQGLACLHSASPPIIHRALKCDNIFLSKNAGEVVIGDLILAGLSDSGNAEFMAPERYDEEYDEKVDIYAFGMCVLEMVVKEYPYAECLNPAQIYKKVTRGIPPLALSRIEDPVIVEFIRCCIAPLDHRWSAQQLLSHTYITTPTPHPEEPVPVLEEVPASRMPPRADSSCTLQSLDAGQAVYESRVLDGPSPDGSYTLSLTLDVNGKAKVVQFPFAVQRDTPETVAQEMVSDLGLTAAATGEVAAAITRLVNPPDTQASAQAVQELFASAHPDIPAESTSPQ